MSKIIATYFTSINLEYLKLYSNFISIYYLLYTIFRNISNSFIYTLKVLAITKPKKHWILLII